MINPHYIRSRLNYIPLLSYPPSIFWDELITIINSVLDNVQLKRPAFPNPSHSHNLKRLRRLQYHGLSFFLSSQFWVQWQ
ncbi:hypothetical protein GBA52_025347 [Prunus armeniaca]|nr:hypothetical protein GBA52_025347 [Prunus armeniaca]